ncbi:MAG: hypothetical protein NVSMB62_28320 [Acidobacteriaceae bacterium]
MLTAAFIEHELPSRLRLKVPSKRGDKCFFNELVQRLTGLNGIAEVRANPVTGSILVRYQSGTEALRSILEQTGLLDVRFMASTLNRERGAKVDADADANQALALGLSGLSFVQAARGQITGTASENLWNSYRAHTHLRNPWLAMFLFGLGVYQLGNGQVLNSATALMFYAFTAKELSREQHSATGRGSLATPTELCQPSRDPKVTSVNVVEIAV